MNAASLSTLKKVPAAKLRRLYAKAKRNWKGALRNPGLARSARRTLDSVNRELVRRGL